MLAEITIRKSQDIEEEGQEEEKKGLSWDDWLWIILPPDTFFLLNGGMELNRNRQPLV